MNTKQISMTPEQTAQMQSLAEQHRVLAMSGDLPNQAALRHLAAYHALTGQIEAAIQTLNEANITDSERYDPNF